MAERRSSGWRVWGLGIASMGLISLVLGRFDPGQPVPEWVPERTLLASAADAFMIAAGLLLQWRPTAMWVSVALTAYYSLVVVVLLNGAVLMAHPATYGTYEAIAEQLALTAAALIICTMFRSTTVRHASLLTRIGRVTFGTCAIVFGGAHFAYVGMTAPLVPSWLPPSQLFWGYATGVFHMLAGVAIITKIWARLASILLTIMYTTFSALVHLPLLFGEPHSAFFWTENALNLALIGSAWVVADSLGSVKSRNH